MNEKIVVRILRISDLKDSKFIRLESLKKSPVNFGSSYEDEILFEDNIWKNRLTNEDVVTFGAYINTDIVGSLALVLNKRLKTKHNAEIHGMYVSEFQQRQGIGYKLINTLIDYVKEFKDIELLTLSVESKNYNAIKLYEKCGFKKFAEVPYALKINSEYHSFIMMNRLIK